MAGEGRGHATRVKAIVHDLKARHRVVLYAPGEAWDMLAPAYKGTEVEVRHIEGLSFYYDLKGNLNYYRTLFESVKKWMGFPGSIQRIKKDMALEKPDLVITDFDPLLPRAAEQMGIPYISINHQHFLNVSDFRDLPWRLRWYAKAMAIGVRAFYGSQKRTVVSAFFFPPLRQNVRNVEQVGVLLRPEVLALKATVQDKGFLVAYLRRAVPRRVVRALRDSGLPVRIYGLGARPSEGQVTFHAIDPLKFVEDLAASKALVCTAGNQLVGEAMYLGKPVFAMPETGNREQEMNGFFLRSMGCGWSVPFRSVKSAKIRAFLKAFSNYTCPVPDSQICGNHRVHEIIETTLEELCLPKR